MSDDALAPRSDFVGLDEVTHLYSGAEGPLLRASAEALQQYAEVKTGGTPGRMQHAEVARRCKVSIADFLQVQPDELAYLPSASDAICAVAGTIDLRPGDNIVVNDLEFPSVFLPWIRMKQQGVELRVVTQEKWDITTDDFRKAIDSRTRAVALSHVSFFSGLRHDLAAISEETRKRKALFLVDATQSLGVLPVDARLADYLVCSTYKWLLGLHGSAILYANGKTVEAPQPPYIGWYSVEAPYGPDRFERYSLKPGAARFETGYPNFPGIYALDRSVPYLHSRDTARIAEHVQALGGLLIDGLTSRGFEVITQKDPERRGASVTFFHKEADAIGQALEKRNILVWAREGRVRASIHLFNSEQDVRALLTALDEIVNT